MTSRNEPKRAGRAKRTGRARRGRSEQYERILVNRPWKGWYSRQAWKDRREQQLRLKPLCERCEAEGRIVAATVVHHKEKHNGDPEKFWKGALESLCKPHHDINAQREELGRPVSRIDEDGWPLN